MIHRTEPMVIISIESQLKMPVRMFYNGKR